MKRSVVLRLFALVAVLSLVGAACASDDEEPTPGGDTGGDGGGATVDCATVEFGCVEVAAGAPIQLASLLAISGDASFLGIDSNHGVQLAIDNLDGAWMPRTGSCWATTSRSSRKTTSARLREVRLVPRRLPLTRTSSRSSGLRARAQRSESRTRS